ncbi:PilN domain-containing protein [Pseudoxanthomonas beigongshangi]|uniref:PilN domain-containing protein n=1 Tax=Pseudoxanthomonas beigongshangi TaxID=2782537 RepID=UPI00193BA9BF|nr:PilN domain-containing protein [Pseudoxanthomonas beigongshangi]
MSTIRDSMDSLRARLLPGAGGLLGWWGRALASWLPHRWRSLLGLTQDRLLLSQQEDQGVLAWQSTEGVRELARLPLPLEAGDLDGLLGKRMAGLPRWLLLPADAVLRRPLVLPAAAADRLRDVVRFEIDRQTPFGADDVCYDASLRQRREDGQLEVDLIVIPRARFDAALAPLGGLASELAGVDVAALQGTPLGVNLLAPAERRIRQAPMRGWHLILASLALVAVVFAAWTILDNRRNAADEFETALRTRTEQARRVAAQRQQLVDLVEGMNALERTRAQRPTAVEVLDELSRRLPDGTHLEKMSIEGDRLVVIGLSQEASSLVAKLQGSPLWRSPALSGALQPDQTRRRDRFTLTAQLVGTTAPPTPGTGDQNGKRAD